MAGHAYYIQDGNYWFRDGARSGHTEDAWAPDSTLDWYIPIGWHRKVTGNTGFHDVWGPDYEVADNASSRPLIVGGAIDVYEQRRHIDDDGVYKTEKFNHWISRSRWCRVILDGVTLQFTHGL